MVDSVRTAGQATKPNFESLRNPLIGSEPTILKPASKTGMCQSHVVQICEVRPGRALHFGALSGWFSGSLNPI